jgi:4'-phosphopantetheinyl transferase
MQTYQRNDCSLKLNRREIHVWLVRTEASPAVIAQFERVLAPDEKARVARFRFEHLQYSYTLARGALRILLGRYLDIAPARIQLVYGTKGKPQLAQSGPIDFNVSHSGELAAFAFTRGCEIGIDLEKIRLIEDMLGIADRFFSSQETADLMSLPASERTEAFFRCWTRKEAYIKAVGDGLSLPLDSFRVTVQAREPAQIMHFDGVGVPANEWTLRDLRLAPDYAAALAYRDQERALAVLSALHPDELQSIEQA